MPSLISISAKPKIPKPICRQSRTDSLCSCKGCKGSPSSRTSFNAITAVSTQLEKSSKSNVFSLVTNSDKLILPNKQLPPAGRGSS